MTSGDVVTVDRGQIAALRDQIGALQAQLAQLAAAVEALSGEAPPQPSPDAASAASLARPRQPQTFWRADALPALIRGAVGGRSQPEPSNGVDIVTGRYLLTLNAEAGADLAKERPDPDELKQLHRQKQRSQDSSFGVVDGIDADDLSQSRWAVVVNASESSDLLKALTPLIRHRAAEQGITLAAEQLSFRKKETCGEWYGRIVKDAREHGRRWLELPPVLIYRVAPQGPAETASGWLARHGVTMGPVDPQRGVPFYLMLAGRPGPLVEGDTTYIPFTFQYQLDQFWGVGRVCFTDDAGAHELPSYTRYAEALIAAEGWADPEERLRREIVYFGTQHLGDKPTTESANQLIAPLYADWHGDARTGAGRFGFARRLFLGDGDELPYRQQALAPEGRADRASLGRLLGVGQAERPPAIFFLAGHGAGLKQGSIADYAARQGALLCQGWQGEGDANPENWFTADELGAAPRVAGMVAVLFACFGAGSPYEDQFVFDSEQKRPQIAPFPMVARLPQRLLLNGSLAVLGHVDRAWSYSFQGPELLSRQSQNFENLLSLIAGGKRLGFATDQFNLVQSALSSNLTEMLDSIAFGAQIPPHEVTNLWKARNDARNYALLGDPAVRLPFRKPGPPSPAPAVS